MPSDVYQKYYEEYCRQLAEVDFEKAKTTLGLIPGSDGLSIPFFDRRYFVSNRGITDPSGNPPRDRRGYMLSVILSNYILRCPDQIRMDSRWVSFKDFKSVSHVTNVNYFSSDTERATEKQFSGRLDELAAACKAIGGVPHDMESTYDLSVRFDALPRISLLLLFNDSDEEFPAKCTVLFPKHAEFYLDPESLAMTGAALAMRLKYADERG
jgi:hypothetical protein